MKLENIMQRALNFQKCPCESHSNVASCVSVEKGKIKAPLTRAAIAVCLVMSLEATVVLAAAPSAFTQPAACGDLDQEAESGVLDGDFVVGNDAAASGGQYVHVPDGSGNAKFGSTSKVTFCMTASAAGTYRVKGWVYAPESTDDSFFVRINGQPATGYLWDAPLGTSYGPDYVRDRDESSPIEVDLTAGEHSITVFLREDGARLDRIALIAATADPLNVAPTVVEDGNPFLNQAFTSNKTGSPDIPSSFSLGTELRTTALGYCHPQSPNAGDTAYRDRLFLLMDHTATSLFGNGDFAWFPSFAHAYALLLSSCAEPLSASRQSMYEDHLRATADGLIVSRGDIWANKKAELVWYNADVRWALGVYLAGLALGDETIESYGSFFFEKDFQEMMLLGDGGFNYVGKQNETYTYHNANIQALTWYFLISSDQDVRQIVTDTIPYFPISTFGGMGEYYTASSWKHYWNAVDASTAYIVGALSGDPYNMDLGRNSASGINAFVYSRDSSAPDIEQPDNYTVYDTNIEGPRGRHGSFGFAGTGRIVDNYPQPTIGVGKSTIAGAHVQQDGGFAFDSAVDIVGLEIKRSPGQETEDRRFKYWFLTTNEKTSSTRAHQIHGLTSIYNPSSKQFSNTSPYGATNWVINEQWIFLPERIVGHLSVNSLIDDQEAYAIGSIIKIVSGRASWGDKKEIIDLGDGHYSFGRLHFVIREQNLGGETITEYAPIYTDKVSEKASYHRIIDNKSSGQTEQLFTYGIADKYHYVVEIFEEGTEPALNISSTRNERVHTLTVDDGTRSVQSVLNITDQHQTHGAALESAYSMATVLNSSTADTPVPPNTPVNLDLPAHNSAMIIESSTSDDINIAENFYSDIFTAAPVNRRPTLVNPGIRVTEIGTTTTVAIKATDPDGDTLAYTASGLPTGLTINSSTGIISGITTTTSGNYTVTAGVTDSNGGTDTTAFELRVEPELPVDPCPGCNRPPEIKPVADQTNAEGEPIEIAIEATDPDGDDITYSANGLPTGLVIGESSGLISGTAAIADNYNVTVTASDRTATDSTSFNWTVTGDGDPGGILVNLPQAGIRVTENDISASVDVTLSQASSQQVSVVAFSRIDTATPGSDYYGFTTTVTFAPGETRKTVDVQILDDTAEESAETLAIALAEPQGATVGTGTSTVTIIDDDSGDDRPAYFSIDAVSVAEDAGSAEVTVTLSKALGDTSSVSIATAPDTAKNGADYYGLFTTLEFAAGETEMKVSVRILNDSVDEGNEKIQTRLFTPSSNARIGNGSGSITIDDDDGF